MNLKKLVNKGIDGLSPYEPGKPIEDLERELGIKNAVKLASNENPLGPSPKIIDSIAMILKETHRYPDGNATRLKAKIALSPGPKKLLATKNIAFKSSPGAGFYR